MKKLYWVHNCWSFFTQRAINGIFSEKYLKEQTIGVLFEYLTLSWKVIYFANQMERDSLILIRVYTVKETIYM